MVSNDEKQLKRMIRERKFRRQMTTLSWTLPVFAFGGFFSMWHNISSMSNQPKNVKSSASMAAKQLDTTSIKSVSSSSAKKTTTVKQTVLLKIGSRGHEVTTLQGQLATLGYFSHVFTAYYGPVTAEAVKSFQSAQHLDVTGEVDSATLTALQQALKNHHISTFTNTHGTVAESSGVQHRVATSSSTVGGTTHQSAATPVKTSAPKKAQTDAPSAIRPSASQQSVPQTMTAAS